VRVALASAAGGQIVLKIGVAFDRLEWREGGTTEVGMKDYAGGVDYRLEAGLPEGAELRGGGSERVRGLEPSAECFASRGDGALGLCLQDGVRNGGELPAEGG